MIIHINQKIMKEQGYIFYTSVDDFLFSKISENSVLLSNGKYPNNTMSDIAFDLDGKKISLFSSESNPQNDLPLWPLFCLGRIDWNNRQQLDVLFSQLYSTSPDTEVFPRPVSKDPINPENANKDNLRPDYMAKLEAAKAALGKEYKSSSQELIEYENILNEMKTLEGLKDNLSKLRQDILTTKEQIKKADENLILSKEKISLYADSEMLLEKNKLEIQELKDKLSSNISKEDLAKQQIKNLDTDLESTNEQGLQYIQKLESIEKKIFSIDQNLALSEESIVPQHVRTRVNELGSIIKQYMKSLEKLEFLSHQTNDLEIAVSEMRENQNNLSQKNDLKEDISQVEIRLKKLHSELARVDGQEESFNEGKKLLSDNVCPIIGKTCTTIEEPVDKFFEKKITALKIDRANILAKIDSLEKTKNDLISRQEIFGEWQTLQAKIFQSLDFIQDAMIDFQKEEAKFLAIPIGDKTLAIIELLRGIISDQQRASLQKRFVELGTSNNESDLVRRIEIYMEKAASFKESWQKAFSEFIDICEEKENVKNQKLDERNTLLQNKEQLRKEYGMICRQVESIEKQRKELSKVLFEAGKSRQFEEYLESLIDQSQKHEKDVQNFKELKTRISKLTGKLEFLRKSLEGMEETEIKYTGEYKIYNHRLNKVDPDEVNSKIYHLREKDNTLQEEILRLDKKIDRIGRVKRNDEKASPTTIHDLFTEQNLQLQNQGDGGSKGEFISWGNLLREKIEKISDLQGKEYLRRFDGKLPITEQKAISNVIKSQILLEETLWKSYMPIAAVFSPEEIFWWKERIDRQKNLLLIGPKKFENIAMFYEDPGFIN